MSDTEVQTAALSEAAAPAVAEPTSPAPAAAAPASSSAAAGEDGAQESSASGSDSSDDESGDDEPSSAPVAAAEAADADAAANDSSSKTIKKEKKEKKEKKDKKEKKEKKEKKDKKEKKSKKDKKDRKRSKPSEADSDDDNDDDESASGPAEPPYTGTFTSEELNTPPQGYDEHGVPTKPLNSGYMLYSQASRASIVAAMAAEGLVTSGSVGARAVMQRISSTWASLGAKDRALWDARKKALAEQYKAAMAQLQEEKPDVFAAYEARLAEAKAAKGKKARAKAAAAAAGEDSDGEAAPVTQKRRRIPTAAASESSSLPSGAGANAVAAAIAAGGGEIDETIDPTLSHFDQLQRQIKIDRLKQARARGVGETQEQVALGVRAFIEKMAQAAEQDRQAVAAGKLAFAKLRDLSAVSSQISNFALTRAMIDQGLLARMGEWVSPLPTRALPHEKVRSEMYRLLQRLHVQEDDIVKSGIGAVVAQLAQHPLETDENKQLLRSIAHKWMRLAMGTAATFDYSKLHEVQAARADTEGILEAARRRQVLQQTASYTPVPSKSASVRPMKPVAVGYDYVVRPGYQVGLDGKRLEGDNDEDEGDVARAPATVAEMRKKQLMDATKRLKSTAGRFTKGPDLNAHKS